MMKNPEHPKIQTAGSFARRHPRWTVLLVCGCAALLFLATRPGKARTPETAYHTVERRDFLVSVIEGGALAATQELQIVCEMEGTPRILRIVPEGTTVKKDDLLVELDSSGIKERLDTQEVVVENARFAVIKAKEDLDIQKLLNDANDKDAELAVEFSLSDLEKYKLGDWPQAKRALEADITITKEEVQRAKDKLDWTTKLHTKGYATRSELEGDQLALKRQDILLEKGSEALRLSEKYDYPKKIRLLESASDQAKLALLRIKQRSKSFLSAAEADLKARQNTLELQSTKLEETKLQLQLAKIFAPQDGLVVFAPVSSSLGQPIEEGAVVRQKQPLIKLPDVSKMMVEIKIHESHVRQVKPGQPAFVTIDSMPDKQFNGVVKKIAPLPDSNSRYYSPTLKVYAAEVLIDEALADFKPGVSARAEIVITNLHKVLTVPIQCVTSHKGRQVCYIARDGTPAPVPVEVGYHNDKIIEIRKGIKEGDRVMLSPLSNGDGLDLDNSIVKDDTKDPLANHPYANGKTLPPDKYDSLPPGVTASKSSTEKGPPIKFRPEKPEKPAKSPGKGDKSLVPIVSKKSDRGAE
ncbi:MAG: efflux RND transporter periplasmic adaptor subunit [Pedosphaera sp.]|nr:efflux RND transporter periplasmic adaptor subunit [Pedosphaera sp.]